MLGGRERWGRHDRMDTHRLPPEDAAGLAPRGQIVEDTMHRRFDVATRFVMTLSAPRRNSQASYTLDTNWACASKTLNTGAMLHMDA